MNDYIAVRPKPKGARTFTAPRSALLVEPRDPISRGLGKKRCMNENRRRY
jgi:hypothetical protein